MNQTFDARYTSAELYGAVVVTILRDHKLAEPLRNFYEQVSRLPEEELRRLEQQTGIQPQQIKATLMWLKSAPALRDLQPA